MRRLKIAMIAYDDHLGGAAVAAKRLAKALLKQEHSLELYVLSKEGKDDFVKPIFKSNSWYKLLRFFYFSIERLYFYFFEKNKSVRFAFSPSLFGRSITKKIDLSTMDIIHLHWVNFGFLTSTELKHILKLGKPVVWTLHDMWAITGGCHHSGDCINYETGCGNCEKYLRNPSPFDLSHREAEKKQKVFSQKSNLHLVACSQWLKNRADKSQITQGTTISAIPNPLDIEVFKNNNKAAAKESLGLNPYKKHILFVAMKTSVLWKGFDYLLKALEIIQESEHIDDTEVIILGKHNEITTAHLKIKIHALGLIKDTTEIVNIYNAADVFVTSSLQENLPNTIMEAMACNVPVVGFKVGGIPEMVDHLQNGYLANYKSSEDLAKGISYILEQGDQLASSPRDKVLANFSEKVVVKQYEQVYENMIRLTN